MTIMVYLVLLAGLILAGSFFAGAETGVYRISRFRLRVGVEMRRPFYTKLSEAIDDGQSLILSLLLGNNIVNYLATTLVTWFLLDLTGDEHRAEIYTTVVMTPVLFIFVDIIPKNIFYYRADALLGTTAPIVWLTWRFFTRTGLIRLLLMMYRLFSRILGLTADTAAAIDVTQRGQARQIIQETRDEAPLSFAQKEMLQRLMHLPDISIGTLLTPLSKIDAVDSSCTRQDLLKCLQTSSHRRIPVHEKLNHKIVGYIDIYDVLTHKGDFLTLTPFIRPIQYLSVSLSVLDALQHLCGKEKIAAVVSDNPTGMGDTKRALGIITFQDLVEELTGEFPSRLIKTAHQKSPV